MYISDLYEDELEISIKVVIVGNGAVGKSSMIQRYCRGIFTNNYKKTIGVDFLEKHLRIGNEDVRLMLWDTAGQEEFDAITKAYYRGAQACVIAFSTTDRSSLEAVKRWKKKVEDECGHLPMVLVQNKIDLLHEAQVTPDEVDRVAKDLRLRLYRTSVKEDLNVANVFQHLADNYVNKIKSFEPNGQAVMQIGGGGFKKRGYNSPANVHYFNEYGKKNKQYTQQQRRNRQVNNNMFAAYNPYSPQDYLSSPMFETIGRGGYWHNDRTITLRPLNGGGKKCKKQAMKPSCKVL